FQTLAVSTLAGLVAAAPLGTRTLEVTERGEALASRSTSAVVTVSALAVSTINNSQGKSTAQNSYTLYTGDGSTAAGWPAQSEWLSFDAMWEANKDIISESCENNGWGENNSETETADLKAAIQQVAKESKVDHRFILAVVLQESKGCVRVKTTANAVSNPGLMQSYEGTGTCWQKSTCSNAEIVQMIRDGSIGTAYADGYGLAQLINMADRTTVAGFYRAARLYNSGAYSLESTDNLVSTTGAATSCYASDIANRLLGWTTAATKSSSSCDPSDGEYTGDPARKSKSSPTTSPSKKVFCCEYVSFGLWGWGWGWGCLTTENASCERRVYDVMPVGHAKTMHDASQMQSTIPQIDSPQTSGVVHLERWTSISLWGCAVLECLASMMYTFMLNWVSTSPFPPGNASLDPPYNLDSVRFLPATLVNVLLLPLIIYTFARSTGGHVNPIITLAAYFTQGISCCRAVLYIVGQTIGGTLAGWAIRKAYGGTEFVVRGCFGVEGVSTRDAYLVETISCFALIAVVLAVSVDRRSGRMYRDALSPWVVGIATEAVFWGSRLLWQGYPGASKLQLQCPLECNC
ncbi:aquaporin-like protein, partial [Aspergillus ibericus CBS 121593]